MMMADFETESERADTTKVVTMTRLMVWTIQIVAVLCGDDVDDVVVVFDGQSCGYFANVCESESEIETENIGSVTAVCSWLWT